MILKSVWRKIASGLIIGAFLCLSSGCCDKCGSCKTCRTEKSCDTCSSGKVIESK